MESEKANLLSGFHENYIAQGFKRILQATMCKSYELLLLEQELENLCHNSTTFPCEEVFSKRKQMIASVEYETIFITEHKKCFFKKILIFSKRQNIVAQEVFEQEN